MSSKFLFKTILKDFKSFVKYRLSNLVIYNFYSLNSEKAWIPSRDDFFDIRGMDHTFIISKR